MTKLHYLPDDEKDEIIAAAMRRSTPCVITCRRGTGWQIHKAKLVDHNTDADRLRAVTPPGEAGQALDLQVGEKVGITFRHGHKKCMLSTGFRGFGAPPAGSNPDDPPSLEFDWPSCLQTLQRRLYYRVRPPRRRVYVRFWAGGVAGRAEVGGEGIFSGVLYDLSAGGMRVITSEVGSDQFTEGEAIGCSFVPKPRGETLVLDAVFRHLQWDSEGSASVGFQFVGLETTESGRTMLAKLAQVVTDYQRGQSQPAPTAAARS